MKVRLAEVGNADLPLIEKWFRSEHVIRFWGEPAKNIRLLREPEPETRRAIIEADGRKVGLILWQHPTRAELDGAGLHEIPTSVIDMDVMVGEQETTGKGVGTAAIRLVAEKALSDPDVPFVIGETSIWNTASIRAFEKAGFRREREFDDPESGRCVLMVRGRD
ncbi:MAG: GNAT family N-acetyltransferase [Thermodesulfobacteriota bacterium]|nr:MAG: GNAT family N-acetyltransferase [Thermodesulfobacteriota bacterium]